MENLQSLHGIHILCIEDHVDTCELITWILTQAGAEVKSARSGQEAMAVVTTWQPHILLADLRLPDMDGGTLLQQIRAINDPGHPIPALAITADARPSRRQEALAAGFQQCLGKPFDPTELHRLVSRLVWRKAAP